MENTRRGDGRKGQPHNNNSGDRKNQPPMGFEGMNYEQKRKPYGGGISEKARNSNSSGDRAFEKRRDDL